jgi:dolichyl-phosphate beta-glucosyltransferase
MPKTRSPFLSVVIPSYNEKKNISRGVLEDIIGYLKNQKYEWELIFSDDGSTDETLELLTKFAEKYSKEFPQQIKILHNVHAGKGPTVQSGMLAAEGEWRLFTDFDQSTPIKELELLLPYTDKFQVIIGSREIAGAKRHKEPFHRHVMGKVFNIVVQVLAIPGILDTQCGFKLFSGKATKSVFECLQVYGRTTELSDAFTGAFDVEALYIARIQGYKIKEVPIFWQHNDTNRVNPVKDSLRMFRDIFKIRWADIQGKYRSL